MLRTSDDSLCNPGGSSPSPGGGGSTAVAERRRSGWGDPSHNKDHPTPLASLATLPLQGRVSRCTCVPPFQIQFSCIRRDSSPLLFGRRGDRRSLPSLTHVRERSAGKALATIWHLLEVPRAVVTRHARLPALHRGDFLRGHRTSSSDRRASPLRSRQHWRCPSSDRVQPPKAAPSAGADDDRASWDEVTSLACRRRTRLRQPSVPRRRPR